MSKMASAVLLVVCWFLLEASWARAQICPMVNSIFPPSGTVQVTFTVRGNNLDGAFSEINVNIGTNQTATIAASNTTHLQFVIGGVLLSPGSSPVFFTASNALCQPQLDALPAIRLDISQGKLCCL